MGRFFFYTYLLLIVSSLILIGHTLIQQIFVILWILMTGIFIIWFLKKTKASLLKVSILGLLSQSPGIFMILISLYSFKTGACEWADGVLEIWIHPFLPFLELLPPKHMGEVSGVFINSCLLPFEIVIFYILIGGITMYYDKNFVQNLLKLRRKIF